MKIFRRTIGALMLVSLFGGIFAMEVHFSGWFQALTLFGIVAVLVLFVILAVHLLTD